ncbi:MAG: sigma-54-dependent Fis family transcriptional regulator [Phycisphaerae bacterium]
MSAHPQVTPGLLASSRSLPAESLSALTEAAAAINSTLELNAVLQTIARLAAHVTHAEGSSVLLLDARNERFVVAAAAGGRRDALMGQEFDCRLGIPGHVLRTGNPVSIADAANHARFHRPIDDVGNYRPRSIIAAPMVHRAEVIGAIEVVNRLDGSDFADADLKLLQVFATLAAAATQNARAYEELRHRFEGLREAVLRETHIIGESPLVREMLGLCDRVAPSNATVLILGETGTGKELCARYIHSRSKRSQGTFAAINCAALTETLLESELFGHEKGSFTGAHAQRRGWFELASGGTLFLDEIGEISRSLQAKLLRVLQEKEFVRVGGTRAIACDVRIIAATNRNLKNMMVDGLFREDLFYRLSVFPIHMPPLRDRQEDIPLLVEHFVRRAVQDLRIPLQIQVSRETLAALRQYAWPGNVRELQNVIERSVLMADGNTLLPCHLPPDVAEILSEEDMDSAATQPSGTLYAQERALILKALNEQGWNQSRAARVLGVTRDHLRHRIKKYGLQRPSILLASAGHHDSAD